MFLSVDASALLRFAENAIPTWEKRRSTEAEDAGHPKYCRAITATFGNADAFSRHHLIESSSVLYLICVEALEAIGLAAEKLRGA